MILSTIRETCWCCQAKSSIFSCRQAKSSIFSWSWSKTQNSDQNRIYPSPTLQTPNKQTKQQTTIFLPKTNKVFLRPILQNLKGRSVLNNFFFKWSSRRAEAYATKQKVVSFQEIVQKRKIVDQIEFNPLSLDRKIVPFKKGWKKVSQNRAKLHQTKQTTTTNDHFFCQK